MLSSMMCGSDVSRDKGLCPNELLQSLKACVLPFCQMETNYNVGCCLNAMDGKTDATKVVSWPP